MASRLVRLRNSGAMLQSTAIDASTSYSVVVKKNLQHRLSSGCLDQQVRGAIPRMLDYGDSILSLPDDKPRLAM